MLVKPLATAAALSVAFASPALAHEQEGGGCNRTCTAKVFQHGKPVATVRVRVSGRGITGTLHGLRNFSVRRGENLPVRGHCRPVREREFRREFRHEFRHVFREEREFRREREFIGEREFLQTRLVPSAGIRTGFGGARDSVSLPLVAAALSLLAGGVGLCGLAFLRRR